MRLVREAHATLRLSAAKSLTWGALNKVVERGKENEDLLMLTAQTLGRKRVNGEWVENVLMVNISRTGSVHVAH